MGPSVILLLAESHRNESYNSLTIMHLPPVVAKTQEFLREHEGQTLFIVRCIAALEIALLLMILGAMLYITFLG